MNQPIGSLKWNLKTIKNKGILYDFTSLMINMSPKSGFDVYPFSTPASFFPIANAV
jgi:hypothetical protein